MNEKVQPGNNMNEIAVGVSVPQTAEEAEALAMWLQATPEQRLMLLVELLRFGKLISGQVAPWELGSFK